MSYSKNNKKTYSDAVAREAWKMVGDAETYEFFATETLEAAMQEADEQVFYAEMSDDYSMTCAERAWIADYIREAREELNRRRAA